jgi:hypothetical protein
VSRGARALTAAGTCVASVGNEEAHMSDPALHDGSHDERDDENDEASTPPPADFDPADNPSNPDLVEPSPDEPAED